MTENSVQNFYNHHEGFMQPTLVENYHHYNYNYQHQMDYNFSENGMGRLSFPKARFSKANGEHEKRLWEFGGEFS